MARALFAGATTGDVLAGGAGPVAGPVAGPAAGAALLAAPVSTAEPSLSAGSGFPGAPGMGGYPTENIEI